MDNVCPKLSKVQFCVWLPLKISVWNGFSLRNVSVCKQVRLLRGYWCLHSPDSEAPYQPNATCIHSFSSRPSTWPTMEVENLTAAQKHRYLAVQSVRSNCDNPLRAIQILPHGIETPKNLPSTP